jgi:hypothetical protein
MLMHSLAIGRPVWQWTRTSMILCWRFPPHCLDVVASLCSCCLPVWGSISDCLCLVSRWKNWAYIYMHCLVQASSATSVFLVIVFSLLLGVGSVRFGMAYKMVGEGLETSNSYITKVIIITLETSAFLPLTWTKQLKGTLSSGAAVSGLCVCCVELQNYNLSQKEIHIC